MGFETIPGDKGEPEKEKCQACKGTGKVDEETCDVCNGDGKVRPGRPSG